VSEVAVIGLPDAERGEMVCAIVVCPDTADALSFESMAAFLREKQLMIQKIPERLEMVDALPRNPTGKVLKRLLRDRFAPAEGA
jgi:cyclohexanecarboxylate-CoA ligase